MASSHQTRDPECVRGLYIAKVQYSSFGGCALGLMLGVLDIVGVEVRNREQVEVRERRGTRDRGRRQNKETISSSTFITSDVQSIYSPSWIQD